MENMEKLSEGTFYDIGVRPEAGRDPIPYSAVRYLGVGDAWCGGDQAFPIEYYVFRSAATQHAFLLVAEECLATAAEIE
jgi:hypothetical protein